MDKDNAHLYLPLVKALAEGKTIQVDPRAEEDWKDEPCPVFNLPPYRYRIKPEPREWDVWIHSSGKPIAGREPDSCPLHWHRYGYKAGRVREILPE